MIQLFNLYNFFGDCIIALNNNPCRILVRSFVKWQSFPYKHLLPIVQFIWQLYAIVVRYRPFRQMSSFLVSESGAKFQSDSLKTVGLVRVYIGRQTDRQMEMAKSTQLVMLIVYIAIYIFYRVSHNSFECQKQHGKLNIN